MQSTTFIETYGHGVNKDLVSEKEEIKCSSKMKGYKKRLILMML